MMQRRHWLALALLIGLACAPGCGRSRPEPPAGELRSALAGPTVAGGRFDPASLGDKLALVTFWSPS